MMSSCTGQGISGKLAALRSLGLVLFLSTLISGCAFSNNAGTIISGSTPISTVSTISGRVHGGQQPVSGATIQMWQVGTTGYGVGATPLGNPVTTGMDGSFVLTGAYSCTQGYAGNNTLVYVTATGGNPGLANATNNSALTMMVGLGFCGNLTPATFIFIDEVTTVASVYALAPFMSPSGMVVGSYGASNQGLINAFATIGNLVDIAGGSARSTTPAGNGIVPQAELNTLADLLAGCVNSMGPSSPGCSALFSTVSPIGGTPPTTVVGAVLSIAENPGYNVSQLLQLSSAQPPFAPALSSAKDWTLSVGYATGGSVAAGLAIDSIGRVWVSNYGLGGSTSSVSLVSNLGVPISNSPYTNANFNGASALAVDANDNVWLANRDGSTAVELNATGTTPAIGVAGGPYQGLSAPSAVAIDPSNNIWFANKGNNSLSELLASNYSSTPGGFTGIGLNSPTSIAFDEAGRAWIANNGGASITRLVPGASPVISSFVGGSLATPSALAIDGSSNIWVADSTTSSITELNSAGQVVSPAAGFTGGGVSASPADAIDGGGNLWVADSSGSAISELSPAGVALSPASGYVSPSISAPAALGIDSSGNVWIANSSPVTSGTMTLTVTEFIGLASPTVTPIALAAKQGQLAQRPGAPVIATTANAGGPYTGAIGAAITFNAALSTAPTGQSLTYAWNFGDGNTGSGVSPTHAYGTSGSYTVTLTVTATNGVTANATASVMIGVFLPSISGFTPAAGPIGTVVTLSGANLTPPSGSATQVTLSQQGGGTIVAPVTASTSSTLSFLIPAGAATGTIAVTVGTNSTSSASPLTVTPSSSFAVTVSPGAGTLIQGQSTALATTVTSTNSFTGLASLSVAGVPAGVTANFQPSSVTTGQIALLTLTAPAGQAVGSANLVVTAVAIIDGQTVTQTASATLNVQAATTSFLGRTVVADAVQEPLAGVTVTFTGKDDKGNATGCTGQTKSDGGGNFSLTNLPSACVGPQLISYDGLTATSPAGSYAGVQLSYTLTSGQVTTSPVLVSLPRIDNAETVQVQQNSTTDQVFYFPTIPGVKVTVYAGTTLSMPDGSQPNPFPLVAISIPLDRLPDKIPTSGMLMPFIVAFQPANAYASQPVAVNFPNSLNTAPGTNVTLVTLDPTHGYMVPYGSATVSKDGSTFVANADPAHPGHGYGLLHFDWHGPMGPGPGPGPNGPTPYPNGGGGGDPVDLSSGLLTIAKTDVVLKSSYGSLQFTRTFRSNSTNAGPFGPGTSHNYGYLLDVSAYVQGKGNYVQLDQPDGSQIQFPLQSNGSFSATTIPGFQGVNVNPVSITNASSTYTLNYPDGTIFRFDTSSQGGLLAFLTSVTDRNGNVVTLTRNSGNPYQITQITDAVGRNLTLTYDGSNRVLSVTDPIGRTIGYSYNGQGTLDTVTDAAGGKTVYGYNGSNQLISITDPAGIMYLQNVYDVNGRVSQQTDAAGGITKFVYNSLNDMVDTAPVLQAQVTDPAGRVGTFRFSTTGYLASWVNAMGQTTTIDRDAQTNLVNKVTDPIGRVTTYVYDTFGNMTQMTVLAGTPQAATTTLTYNTAVSKPTSITDPSGQKTTFTLDSAGNILSSTNSLGQSYTYTRGGHGEVLTVTDPAGDTNTFTYANGLLSTITDGTGKVYTITTDGAGRVLSASGALGETSNYQYNPLDQVSAVIDPKGFETDLAYDPNGNLVSVTDALKHTTQFTYDALGRRTQKTDPLGKSETYTYDPVGNLISFVDRRGVTSKFTYDALGNPLTAGFGSNGSGFESSVSYTYDAGGRMVSAVDPAVGSIVHHYDAYNRLTQEITPQGSVSYTYDAAGRRTSLQAGSSTPIHYGYDGAGRVSQITQGTLNSALSYDSVGRTTSLTLPNGVTQSKSYDGLSDVTAIDYTLNGKTLGNLTYSYQGEGTLSAVGGSLAATIVPAAASGFAYNANNQMTKSSTASLTYDANGNLLSDGTNTYTWNARNQLASINGGQASFQYDPFGRRIAKTIGAASTNYLYDGFSTAQEFVNGALSASLMNGPSVDQILARTDASGTQSVLTDVTGSTVAVTDASGNINSSYKYGPFGSVQTTGSPTIPNQFTGRENDGTGLYYYRARYYSPTLGRFISEDPAGFLAGVNGYSYVGNDPTDATDPSGKFVNVLIGAGVGLVVDLAVQLIKDPPGDFHIDVCELGLATVAGGVSTGISAYADLGILASAVLGSELNTTQTLIVNAEQGHPAGTGLAGSSLYGFIGGGLGGALGNALGSEASDLSTLGGGVISFDTSFAPNPIPDPSPNPNPNPNPNPSPAPPGGRKNNPGPTPPTPPKLCNVGGH
jgi:RHS repeat-associated protein